jgi:catecholate siderophore receptor
MRISSVSSLLVMAFLASPTMAAESDDDSGTIVVTGVRETYHSSESDSATKTNTPILDIPQSISIITNEQISDQNIRSMADLAHLIPGVSAGQGEGHRDQITLRGNNSTADFFVDGLRDDAQYFRSFYNVDRVEALKGPNAMIFGRGGGGGVINRVTKSALISKTQFGATAAADRFGAWTVTADLNQPLSKNVAARLNGFYESLTTHRDAFRADRLGVNPVLGADLGNWQLQLGYEYVRDDRVIDRGIPSAFPGTLAAPAPPPPGLRDRHFGVRGVNKGLVEAHRVTFRSRAQLTDTLAFTAQALWAHYDKAYTNAFPATAISAARTIGIEAYRDLSNRSNFIAQANLEWKTHVAGMEHVILLGGEATRQNTQSERISGFFNPNILTAAGRRATITFADPLIIPPISFVSGPTGNNNRRTASDLSQASAYVQDQIRLGGGFELIGGLRFDRLLIKVTNRFNGAVMRRPDLLWSPRIGLVYKPVPHASLYLSRSKSYLPQSGDQFQTFDLNFAALKPEAFDNLEAGAKWDITPNLTATVAVYQLDRANTRATGPTPGTFVLTGEQRSKGVELGLTGAITPHWHATVGYAYTKATIRSATAAAPAGRSVAQVPRHQLSLWNRYDVSPKLGFGLGLYHQSKSFTTISNVTQLPSYTRLDAALFATLAPGVEAQINVENLANTPYYPAAHDDNNISTGAPRTARLSLAFKM